jgi:hypothetical protein
MAGQCQSRAASYYKAAIFQWQNIVKEFLGERRYKGYLS